MRLSRITLINRAPFDFLELLFDDENVAIFSGKNGTGKTTVISYVVDAFYELAKKAYENEFEDKPNKFYRVSSSQDSLKQGEPSIVYLRFQKNDGTAIDYLDLRGECSEEIFNKLVLIPNKIPFSNISGILKREGIVKYWSIADKDEIKTLFSSSLLTFFPAYRYEVPHYLNDPYRIQLSFNTDMSYTGYLPNPIEVTSDLPQIANWIMDIVLDLHQYKGSASQVFNQLNDITTQILSSKVNCRTRLGIGPRTAGGSRIAIMDRDNDNHQIYPSIFCMSSGELALLCFFGEMVKQADTIGKAASSITGIVLVDEIDKHLHIKLQKEALPVLFTMFPGIQFIVSSHSPFFSMGFTADDKVAVKIYDLDNKGLTCLPHENKLFEEVYNMMIAENESYFAQYKALQAKMHADSRPLIITEGKTDWKHLEAAMKALHIPNDRFEIYEYDDVIGDKALLQILRSYSRINQSRKIIGMFDRDNFDELKFDKLIEQEYVSFGNNVYSFSIPLVNQADYGNEISIEHYYKKHELTKLDSNGRRLFLGGEFYASGISKDGKYHTRIKGIEKKIKHNGIVDEKVYDIMVDPEGKHSIALSKNAFSDLIFSQDSFADGFDFSAFKKIFDIIDMINLVGDEQDTSK